MYKRREVDGVDTDRAAVVEAFMVISKEQGGAGAPQTVVLRDVTVAA